MLKITTNNHWRNFINGSEVPEKVLKEDFDWLTGAEYELFIKYKDNYYSTQEFMRVEGSESELSGWDGIRSHSYYSGVVIKLSEDNEQYKIGWFCS